MKKILFFLFFMSSCGFGAIVTNTTSGGTSGANTGLSNLSGVAINTSLLPTSGNSLDLGSTSLNWRDIYVRNAFKVPTSSVAVILDGSTNSSVDLYFRSSASGNNEIRLSGHSANGIYLFATEALDKGGFGVDNNGTGGNGRLEFSPDGFSNTITLVCDSAGCEVGNVGGAAYFQFDSQSLATIQGTTPSAVGQTYYCSNCTTDAMCISTGTARGAFSRVTARTTACQ